MDVLRSLRARVALGFMLCGGLALCLAFQQARASCGSAFCTVNSNWNLQGVAAEPGFRFDFRYEYINQDQPRSGRDKVAVGQVPQDHDEVKTINRNYIATLDYTVNDQWGVSATMPVSDRTHFHIDNDSGTPEYWHFTRMGDVRVLGRYQLRSENQQSHSLSYYGLNFGLKLPTGSRDIVNSEGERAERSLQPGTGTTDLLLGAYYSQFLPRSNASWFVQGLWQKALNYSEDYRPGQRAALDLGYRYELTDQLGLMVQLNALYKGRDSGLQAEPQDTGGKFLFVSPGMSYAVTRNAQLYGFVQLPVYQYVNGVQLTADWSAVVGISSRF